MKKDNNNHAVIHHHPSGVTVRPTRRGYRIINPDDWSSRYRAMMAHLRATDYPARRWETSARPNNAIGNDTSRAETLLDLSRRYHAQASRNFIRDTALLAITAAIAAWAFIHTIQAMAGS